MKYNKDKYSIRDEKVELKDGRILFTKNGREDHFIQDTKGNVTPVSKSYYDARLKNCKLK